MEKAIKRLRELRNPKSFVGRFVENLCFFLPACLSGMIIGISLGIGDGDITAGMFYAIVLSVMISAVRGITAKPGESFWKTPI